MIKPKQLAGCFYQAVIDTLRHDGVEHAGYLAFMGLLAMFPFLVFVVAVIGFIGQGNVGAEFITSLLSTLPPDVTVAIKPRIVEIISGPPQGLLTVSILGAIWTASSAVEGLRTVLNRAYRVATPPAYLLRRSLSILQLLIFTFITISAMMLLVAIPLFLHHVEDWLGIHFISANTQSWGRIVFAFTIIILFVGIAYIYYVIPNIRQRLVSVAPGALITVIGWLLAAYCLTLYFSNFHQVNLIYGSLGGIIAALVFFYLCSMIFIFGAEFNYQIVHLLGLHLAQRDEAAAKSLSD